VLARAESEEEPPRPDIVQLRSLLEDAADGVEDAFRLMRRAARSNRLRIPTSPGG
jgi:hypothetical protein